MTEDQYLKSSSLKLEIITDIINNRVRLEYFGCQFNWHLFYYEGKAED